MYICNTKRLDMKKIIDLTIQEKTKLEKLAKKENRSLKNFIEQIIKNFLEL